MKLIKMGRNYINMDLVTEIQHAPATQYSEEEYRLYFGFTVDGYPTYTPIDGADMIALEMWLEDNSEDIRKPMMVEE